MCENRYLKVLGPLTEKIDAIEDVSLIKDVFVSLANCTSSFDYFNFRYYHFTLRLLFLCAREVGLHVGEQ